MNVREFEMVMRGLPAKVEAKIPEALMACKEIVYGSITENFTEAKSPDGASWPPWKESYAKSQEKTPHPLLILTGALVEAATGQRSGAESILRMEGNDTLVFGVDPTASSDGGIKGAARHNYPDPLGFIRQREFMGISEEAKEACVKRVLEVFADYIEEGDLL